MIEEMALILILFFFSCLDGDFHRSTSNGVYISQPARFARVRSQAEEFNKRNLSRFRLNTVLGFAHESLKSCFKFIFMKL